MIPVTAHARGQIKALGAHYLRKERYGAFRNLLSAVRIAASHIEADPAGGLPHPTPYPAVARWQFRWIKVHRYWIAWSMFRDRPVMTNILFETSNMPDHVRPDDGDEEPL